MTLNKRNINLHQLHYFRVSLILGKHHLRVDACLNYEAGLFIIDLKDNKTMMAVKPGRGPEHPGTQGFL